VRARKLELACPLCGSAGVFYSCTPNCCFNHVCGDCGGTFEPATRLIGPADSPVEPPDPLPEASDPTVACARCESTAVYLTAGGALVCASCRALLELEYTEVSGA
jgi:hypothetical protein